MARRPMGHLVLSILIIGLIAGAIANWVRAGQINLWQSTQWAAIEVTAAANQT